MTDLKFRAWDTQGKKMHEVGQLTLDDFADWTFQSHRNTEMIGIAPFLQPHIEIMQSTGLADVNGKEIFEGDILLSEASDNPQDHKKWVVLYEDGGFVCDFKFTPKDKRKRHLHEVEPLCEDNIQFYQFKVIGNIYENPEVIEERKD